MSTAGQLGGGPIAGGRVPIEELARLSIQLESGTTAGSAARVVCLWLLDGIEANVDGVEAGADPEYLHRLRVATRRSRAVLAGLPGVFDPDAVGPYRAELKRIARLTGLPRDLDVLLLRWPGLASGDEAILEDARRILLGRRRRAHDALVQGLRAQDFAEFRIGWRALLATADRGAGPAAGEPAGRAAARALADQHEAALERGRSLTVTSTARSFHRMRLECKKLRYLLEAFRSLAAAPAMSRLIDALRQLQDNLGEINDLAFQRETLAELAAAPLGAEGPGCGEALARLTSRLDGHQRKLRAEYAAHMRAFDTPKVAAIFSALFA